MEIYLPPFWEAGKSKFINLAGSVSIDSLLPVS